MHGLGMHGLGMHGSARDADADRVYHRLLAEDALVTQAATELGILRADLSAKPYEAYAEKGLPEPVVKLRYEHAVHRRRMLAQEIIDRCSALELNQQQQQQEHHGASSSAGFGVSAAGSAGSAANMLKSQIEDRQMAQLARRRQELLEKEVQFAVMQAEVAQRNDELKRQEARKAEEEQRRRRQVERDRVEAKKRREEEILAQDRAAEAAYERKRSEERARERERARLAAIQVR